jgi:hypothetical protein
MMSHNLSKLHRNHTATLLQAALLSEPVGSPSEPAWCTMW